jgi:hypothetical protein
VREDQPLPGMPEPPAPRMRKAPPDMHAVRTRPTKLCEKCCQLIHLRGQGGAPYPRAARWRVTSPGGVERLCDTHKDERLHP